MHDVKDDIVRIANILRDSFNDVLITGSYLINRVFNVRIGPEETINEAEVLSSMFRSVAVLTDDIGFLNSLGSLGIARVRGPLAVFVYDVHDVRPFCALMGLPCLEPWDAESLVRAIRESRDYSEAFELPYVVRLGPWLGINEGTSGVGVKRREPTFNKNWGEPMRWGLNRLLSGFRREVPEEVRVRSRDNITVTGKGDGILVSGSAWPFMSGRNDIISNYSVILSLYMNPLPRDSISAKYVVDTGNYLTRELGIDKLAINDLDRWYNDLVSNALQQLFFRGPGDPLMLLEWLFSKHVRQGEVPIIVIDPSYAHITSTEGLAPSFDMLPTFFEPRSFDQVVDFVTNPLAATLAFLEAGYGHGRLIAVVNPCALSNLEGQIREIANAGGNYLIIIPLINDECGDAIHVLDRVGIDYRVINYDPGNPPASLQDILGLANSRGIAVIKMLAGQPRRYVFRVVDEYCDNCGDCLRINCPAIQLGRKPIINAKACVGCGICQLVCSRGAIVRVDGS